MACQAPAAARAPLRGDDRRRRQKARGCPHPSYTYSSRTGCHYHHDDGQPAKNHQDPLLLITINFGICHRLKIHHGKKQSPLLYIQLKNRLWLSS